MEDFSKEEAQNFTPVNQKQAPIFSVTPGGKIKLDYHSPLETSLSVLAGIAIIATILSVMAYKTKDMNSLLYLSLSVLFTAISYFLYKNTDCYWVLDPKQKTLSFHRQIGSFVREFVCHDLADFTTMALYYQPKSTKHSSWMETCVVLCTKKGKIVQVTEWIRSDHPKKHGEANETAYPETHKKSMELSKILEMPVLEDIHENMKTGLLKTYYDKEEKCYKLKYCSEWETYYHPTTLRGCILYPALIALAIWLWWNAEWIFGLLD